MSQTQPPAPADRDDLTGPVPAWAQPTVGPWGPAGVPSTAAKKRARWVAIAAFVGALIVLLVMWYVFWNQFN